MKPGNPNSFPFDVYEATLLLSSSIQQGDSLPLTIFTLGDVQGFIYTVAFQSSSGASPGPVIVTFDFQRSATTKIFAAVIFIRECAR
jgi:hypothetical protein